VTITRCARIGLVRPLPTAQLRGIPFRVATGRTKYASYDQFRALYESLDVGSESLNGNPASTEAASWRKRLAGCNKMPH
jgi:hypothetical protein